MKLAEIVSRVSVDPRKLTEYVLNPQAPRGRHKALVFEQVLGFTRQNYHDLLTRIEQQALEAKATFHSEDEFGRRYTVDLTIQGTEERRGMVRTGWLVPPDADEARLVTLYVRRQDNA